MEARAAQPPCWTAYGIPRMVVPCIRLLTFHPAKKIEKNISTRGETDGTRGRYNKSFFETQLVFDGPAQV